MPKLICIPLHPIIGFRNPLSWRLSGLSLPLNQSVTLASCRGQEKSKIFNIKLTLSFRESTTTTIFRLKARMWYIYKKSLAINLFSWQTYFKTILSTLQPLCIVSFLQQRQFHTLLLLPWRKSLFAPRFLGFKWPVATRVLSRSKSENPGNEVDLSIPSYLTELNNVCVCAETG